MLIYCFSVTRLATGSFHNHHIYPEVVYVKDATNLKLRYTFLHGIVSCSFDVGR